MRPDLYTTDETGAARYERDRALDAGEDDDRPTRSELLAELHEEVQRR